MKEKKAEKNKEQKQIKSMSEELEGLREEMEQLQKEKDELLAKLQRVSADYANFQKRTPKQIADTVTYEKEMIIKTLLPVLDNFEHALANADSAENVDVVVKGIRIVYDQMLDILKLHEVEQIKAVGEKFDPAVHEAMLQRAEPEKEDDIVLEEFQRGYVLNGRVIRPSKVIVNKHPSEVTEEEQARQAEEYKTEQAEEEPEKRSEASDATDQE